MTDHTPTPETEGQRLTREKLALLREVVVERISTQPQPTPESDYVLVPKGVVDSIRDKFENDPREGSRAEYALGPNGEEYWHDYVEIGKSDIEALLAARPTPADDAERREGGGSIVDRARAIIIGAIDAANARTSRKDRSYFDRLREDVAEARPAQMDTWLVLDAVIAALTPRTTEAREALDTALVHFEELARFAQTRIDDGKELGAAVWRIALEDVVKDAVSGATDARAALEAERGSF